VASLNVLITAASRRVPLVRAFRRTLDQLGSGSVIVTDVNPLSPAVYAADRAFRVSMASEPGYVDEIFAIAAAADVGLIVPTIDDELTPLALALPMFREAGIHVAVSNAEATAICNDKHATCRTLAANGIAAAASFLPAQIPAHPSFPLFIKPRFGRGSIAAFPVRSQRELEFFLDYVPEPVLEEYLDGPEYTIDMLCDFAGRPLSIVPRERVVIRAGVTDRGRTSKDPRLIALAEACASALTFSGPVNIQCRIVGDRPVVFEINARFSGGVPLTIAAGADFPRMLVDLALGRRVQTAIGQFRENVWITNYETAIFLEMPEIKLEPFDTSAGSAIEEVV
jgi:carbamoyl-phosphate synthase large subunit